MKKIITLLSLVLICKISLAQFPTFSVSSPQGFVITCGNPTVIIYVTSTSTTLPVYTFTVVSPGTYTLSAGSGTMTTQIPLSIIADTVAPNISVAATGSVLSCANSSIQLQGSSTTASVNYLWTGNQGTIASTPGLNINANYTVAPNLTPFGTYSLTVTNQLNQCTSNSVVTIYQNIYPPNASITSSFGALTCSIYSIALTNNSSTGIPPNLIFPNNQPVTVLTWGEPSPGTGQFGNSILAYIPGQYTLTVKDPNNGCISKATFLLGDNRIYPVINAPIASTINCPTGTVALNASVPGNQSILTYSWITPPGAITSGNSSGTLTTNSEGLYHLVVTNNQTNCTSLAAISVYGCVGLNNEHNILTEVGIFPNPVNDKLHFNFDQTLALNSNLIISNSLGQTVFSKASPDLKNDLDLNFLKPGIYFLRLECGIYSKDFKILKE